MIGYEFLTDEQRLEVDALVEKKQHSDTMVFTPLDAEHLAEYQGLAFRLQQDAYREENKIYPVKSGDKVVMQEPELNAWYCGFSLDKDEQDFYGGLIAQYVGDGLFYDDDYSTQEINMKHYDYLVRQG